MADLFSANFDIYQYHRDNAGAEVVAKKAVVRSASVRIPPVLPIEIAREQGATVLFGDFTGEIENSGSFFDALTKTVYCNEQMSAADQTFSIAVQIGHFDLHEKLLGTVPDEFDLFLPSEFSSKTTIFSLEAMYYASFLLVPRRFLEKYARVSSPQHLADIFIVPVEVIQFRLYVERLHANAA